MKRGKKHEDDFDREFNQLRITNPKAKKKKDKDPEPITEDVVGTATTAVDDAAVSRPWEAIDDFGDVGLRGNFMVVVQMDVERGSVKPTLTARNQDDSNVEWVGKPNFKKFKKMKSAVLIERRPTVELIVSEENDYGIGNAYWKSGASGSQSHSDSQDISAAHPPLPRSKSKPPSSKATRAAAAPARGRQARTVAEDEDESIDLAISEVQDDEMMDEDEGVPAAKPAPRNTRSKAGAKAPASPKKPKKPASKASKTTAKPKAKAPSARKGKQPALFLSDPSDEEYDDAGAVDLGDSDGGDSALVSELIGDDREAAMTSTLRSTAGTQVRRAAARTVKRPVALVDVDGDSDDDAVFKGFGGRKRGRIG
jgi:hypothetical protein